MKKLLQSVFLVALFIQSGFPQNWLPLEVGNKWQFFHSSITWSPPPMGIVSITFGLSNINIYGKTVLNDTLYFYCQKTPPLPYSNLIRYSQEDKKIYIRRNTEDKVYMDFNLNLTDTLTVFNSSVNQLIKVNINEGEDILFSDTILFKGYKQQYQNIGVHIYRIEDLFIEGIGWYYLYFWNQHNTFEDNYQNLIMAVLYDSVGNPNVLSVHNKPIINTLPITTVYSNLFELDLSVDHHFNRYPTQLSQGFSFIDSIYFESYYSREDSIISLPEKIKRGTYDGNYTFIETLDSVIMKDGYTFNYRIIAKDKGIIPETSYSPDTGYYKCVWNGPTGIDYQTQFPFTFSLSQNYPNPFNPSTKISWQSPVGSWQTLKIYDALGREIETLVNEYQEAGNHSALYIVNSTLPSGIYFYQLKAGEFIETKKMLLIK